MKSIIHTNTYKTMRVIAGFLLLLGVVQTYAQPVNNQIKDVTMPAPNAAALGKYGDYSVGNFTGVPDISVPIYTVQEGSLSLPISLSYHASGIKVAEMASWVGAGWSLGAGGIISRTVQGTPDEIVGKGYYHMATYLENQIIQTGSDGLATAVFNGQIADGTLDGEPDLFSFNVQGYSGKFYIDKSRNAQFIPKQDLKLEIDDNLLGFTIITPDGTRYVFGRKLLSNGTWVTAQEKTLMQDQATTERYTSSWYLVKIETSDKKFNISLDYVDEAYSYLNAASGKYTLSTACGGLNVSPSSSYNTGIDAYHKTFRTYIDGKRLSQISCSSSTVNFTVSTDPNVYRLDLDDNGFSATGAGRAKSLDKIEIISGDRCQKYDLAYTYFQDLSNPTPNQPALYKKLKLNSVTQKSCDNTILNPP